MSKPVLYFNDAKVSVNCPKTNLNLRIQTELITDEADAIIVFVRFLGKIWGNENWIYKTASAVAGSILKMEIIIGYFGYWLHILIQILPRRFVFKYKPRETI